MKLPIATAFALILLFSSCAVTGSRIVDEPVRAGMDTKELLARYGTPLEIKRNDDGSQDWTYRFATTAQSMGPEWDDDRYYAGDEASKSITIERARIHLSPSLEVSGKIPSGKVVRK